MGCSVSLGRSSKDIRKGAKIRGEVNQNPYMNVTKHKNMYTIMRPIPILSHPSKNYVYTSRLNLNSKETASPLD